LPGVTFNPYRYVAGTAPYQGIELDGIRMCVTSPALFKPVRTSVMLLAVLASCYGKKRVWGSDGARPEWFDKLYGTDATRRALQSGEPSGLFQCWSKAAQGFRRERQEVLLYR